MNEKFCGRCGQPIEEGMYSCPKCGSPVGQNSEYGANPVNSYPPVQKKKKNTVMIVIVIVIVCIILAAIGSAAEKYAQNRKSASSASATLAPVITLPPSPSADKMKYKKGSFTETTYESEFIGVRYTAPEGWSNKSEEELSKLYSEENVTGELYSVDNNSGTNIIISVEKIPIGEITAYDYIQILKSNIENDLSISNYSDKGTYCKIAGETYNVMSYQTKMNGTDIKQTWCVRKINNCMVCFTISSKLDYDVNNIINSFVEY